MMFRLMTEDQLIAYVRRTKPHDNAVPSPGVRENRKQALDELTRRSVQHQSAPSIARGRE